MNMKFKSPHLSSAIRGDSRHPTEVAESEGKVLPQQTGEEGFYEPRMDKTIRFNPDIGALELSEEGAVLFCHRVLQDPID